VNKTQLVSALSRRTALPLDVVQAVVDALFDEDGVVANELLSGNTVALRGFGTFEPRVRKARMARNPSSGAPILLPPTVVAAFKPSERLRDKMRG